MLTQTKLSAVHVLSAGFWVMGFVLVIVDLLTPYETGELGILLAGIGAVLNIRGFIEDQGDRETNAFTLGRDSIVR